MRLSGHRNWHVALHPMAKLLVTKQQSSNYPMRSTLNAVVIVRSLENMTLLRLVTGKLT